MVGKIKELFFPGKRSHVEIKGDGDDAREIKISR
jgi:hypothetical protein